MTSVTDTRDGCDSGRSGSSDAARSPEGKASAAASSDGAPVDVPPAGVSAVPDVSLSEGASRPTGDLLNDVDRLLGRFVALPSEHARHAIAAWVLHTHAIAAFESTPRLAILSPEKGSGKTRLLEVLGKVVASPVSTANISAAALFRLVDQGHATLLLDEADTFFGTHTAQHHEDLRGLVNAGHRRGSPAYRCVRNGSNQDVVPYESFAPVALAGIGNLPDTVLDRSIVIAMQRRKAGEHVEQFRHREVRLHTDPIREELSQWAVQHIDSLETAYPDMPAGIVDRPADVWEPLIAIGDLAGDPWSPRIRRAAQVLNNTRASHDPSLGVRLLADCKRLFTRDAIDRISSADLATTLAQLEEGPWGDLHGKELDPRGLAKFLSRYDIKPHQIRFDKNTTRKGYESRQFHDAWNRYVPGSDTSETNETLT